MKLHTLSHTTGAVCGALIATCALLVYQLRIPTLCTSIHDSALSPLLQKKIQDCISPNSIQTYTIDGIYHTLKKIAPSIHSVSLHCGQPYHRTITITHTRPCAQLTEGRLLGIDGSYIAAEEFVEEYYTRLPRISMQDNSASLAHRCMCAQFIATVPADIINEYQIEWHNKTEILLTLISDPRITLIAHAHILWKESLMRAIHQLIPRLIQRTSQNKRAYNMQSWLVDIRMSGYLIVRSGSVDKGAV